jgi:hypothetical protein
MIFFYFKSHSRLENSIAVNVERLPRIVKGVKEPSKSFMFKRTLDLVLKAKREVDEKAALVCFKLGLEISLDHALA